MLKVDEDVSYKSLFLIFHTLIIYCINCIILKERKCWPRESSTALYNHEKTVWPIPKSHTKYDHITQVQQLSIP